MIRLFTLNEAANYPDFTDLSFYRTECATA